MDNREEIKKELNEQAPHIAGMETKNPFSVPHNYFQGLPDKTLQRIRANHKEVWTEKLESWLNELFSTIFQPRYAIPAAMCFILLAIGVTLKDSLYKSPIDISAQLSEISTSEIDEYVLNNIDEYDLTAYNGAQLSDDFVIPEGITNEDLNNFLLNNSDIQNLEEELL